MAQYRIERLNAQLREEIATLILRGKVKDPRVSTFVSIVRVEVTRDLSFAKVYVSSFLSESQTKRAVEGLNSAAPFIQSVIAKKMRIRQFPRISFVLDPTVKDAFNMVEKLTDLEAKERAQEKVTASYINGNNGDAKSAASKSTNIAPDKNANGDFDDENVASDKNANGDNGDASIAPDKNANGDNGDANIVPKKNANSSKINAKSAPEKILNSNDGNSYCDSSKNNTSDKNATGDATPLDGEKAVADE